MDSSHSENRPSNYDSGDEWEIGLGNLIIDLDADLEKDKQDGTSTKNSSSESSPLRIGKMKIKRKVSSSKSDNPSSIDSKETCNSPETIVVARTEENVSQSAPKGLVQKGGAIKADTQGESELKKPPETSKMSKHVEQKDGKSNKNSDKSGEDGKKKEGSKRSSDGNGSRKPSGKRPKLDKSSNCSIGIDTMDMGTITEPESLGPCEPGTAVTLEGIVWHENDQGVLVVNVTWRNKTYVGTLLDCSQHNWAPPRFCDSPTSDVESRQTKSSSRSKRGRSSNSTSQDKYTETRSSMHSKLRNSTMAKGRRTSNSSSTGRRTPPSSNERISSSSKRKVKSSDVDTAGSDESWPSAKRTKSSHKNSESSLEKNCDGLISCPEPNCNKKYKHINGLRYHKMHAHLNQNEESASPTKEKLGDDHTFKKPREDFPVKEKNSKQSKAKSDESHIESTELENEEEKPEEKESKSGVSQEDVQKENETVKKLDQNNSHIGSCSSKNESQSIVKKNSNEDSPKKASGSCPHTANADLSVFDFNPSLEETESGDTTPKSKIRSPDKVGAPHQKHASPNIDSSLANSEMSTISSLVDKLMSKDAVENVTEKKLDKDKLKGEKHKRREKSLLKPLKSTARPIAPALPVLQPQLIAIPMTATIVKPVTMPQHQATTVTVTAIPTVTTKLATVGGSTLKPIQPKPTVLGEPSTVNPSLASLKEKKQKVKKKKEKEKEREGKLPKDKEKRDKEKKPEKPQGDQISTDGISSETRPKVAYISPVPETNILKQALTSSISPLEMLNPSIANHVPSTGAGPLFGQPSDSSAKDVPKHSQPPTKPPGMGLLPSQSPSKPPAVGVLPIQSPTKPSGLGLLPSQHPAKPSGLGLPTQSPSKPSGLGLPTQSPSKPSGLSLPTQSPSKPSGLGLPFQLPSKPSGLGLLPTQLPSKPFGLGLIPSQPPAKPSGLALLPSSSKPSGLGTQPIQTPSKPEGLGLLPTSSAMPEIPKLISVSQMVSSSFPPYSTGHLSESPNMAVSTSVITKTVQSSQTSIPAIPPIETMSVDPTRVPGDPKPTSDTSRKTASPAYSDISDEGGDTQNPILQTATDIRVPHHINDHFKMSPLSLLSGNHDSEKSLQTNVTLPLPTEVQPRKENKTRITPGMIKVEKEDVNSVSTRPSYNGHFAVVPPYYPMESKHPIDGVHPYKHLEKQKSAGKNNELPGADVPDQSNNHAEPTKTFTDPKGHTSNRIHSELEGSTHRGDPKLSQRVQSGPEKIASAQCRNLDFQDSNSERKNLSTPGDRKEREGREVKSYERNPSQTPDREPREGHSTGASELRVVEQHSTATRTERPPSHGQRVKPSRSVSPRYRNSNWEEKNRYSSSPSRSKPERSGEQLPSPQNGVPGYPSMGYIPNPYMQYGAIAYDPNHPAFNPSHPPFGPMVAYPTLMQHDVPYSTAHRHWQGPDVRERSGQIKDTPSSSSSSLSIPSTSRTSEAHERPTKALDMFAHGNDSYSRHRPRSGSPDRAQRPSSSSAPKANSPMTAKSPPRSAGVVQDPRVELARRQEAFILQQQMLHQHLHTHQHTHLGMAQMGFPGLVPPYEPYILAANHPAAAAAAAAAGVNPFAVRRE